MNGIGENERDHCVTIIVLCSGQCIEGNCGKSLSQTGPPTTTRKIVDNSRPEVDSQLLFINWIRFREDQIPMILTGSFGYHRRVKVLCVPNTLLNALFTG